MKVRLKYLLIFIAFLLPLVLSSKSIESAAQHRSIFRYTGDGKLSFFDPNTGEKTSVVYRSRSGVYRDGALAEIDHAMRCHGRGQEVHPISLKLVELIDHIQDHFEADDISVVSGYRSPRHNENLRRKLRRVAHNSLHTHGMAMDIRLPGVSKRKLGKFARSLRAGGVGVYRRSNHVHIDVGEVKSW